MKKLRSLRPAWVLLTAVIPLLGSIGRAQLPEGAAGGMNAALTQLFGRATFFSAKVDVVVLDPAELRRPGGQNPARDRCVADPEQTRDP